MEDARIPGDHQISCSLGMDPLGRASEQSLNFSDLVFSYSLLLQGTDPATDFRGMGLLGLRNLLYMAENYNDKLRKIISDQTQRNEHEYPVAVAGINVSQMLFELLHVGAESTLVPRSLV